MDPSNHDLEDRYRPRSILHRARDLVVISGCSGGGKSALLGALASRGYRVFPEAGRQIVKEQSLIGGTALPWHDLGSFVELTVSRALHQLTLAAAEPGPSFLDRGIIDQVAALEQRRLPVPPHLSTAITRCRYHDQVFVVPPWREIFRADEERRHSFAEAVESYEHLLASYRLHGYEIVVVPPGALASRTEYVLDHLASR